MRYKFITIEGNIGAGKTSFAKLLSEQLNARLILESFEDNPFLPKFYQTPGRYAFPLELFFMAERFQQLKQMTASADLFGAYTISDFLFIKSLLFARVTLSDDELQLYQRLFNIINPTLPAPDLTVYLHNPVEILQAKIQKRGREYEQKIPADYLKSIEETYFNYFKQQQDHRILVVDTSGIDFVNDREHYDQLIDLLDRPYDKGLHYLEILS